MMSRLVCRFSSVLCGLLIAVIMGCFACQGAWAQTKYTVLRLNEKFQDEKAVKRARSNKAQAMNAADFDEGAQKRIDEYYKNYFVQALSDIQLGGSFGDMRIELRNDLSKGSSVKARAYVKKLMLTRCHKLATDDRFHPLSRYNATLVLSDLNDVESPSGKPPVPKKVVYGFLVKQLGKDLPDAVKVATLVGLKRHVQLRAHPASTAPLDEASLQKLSAAVLKILSASEAPEGRSADGHDWMRRQAAELLGHAGHPAAVPQLVSVLADSEASNALRCEAAQALGRIDLAKTNQNAPQLVALLGKLTADCSTEEVNYIIELRKASGGRGGREYGGGRTAYNEFSLEREDEIEFVDQQTVPIRRRLLTRLKKIQFALNGLEKKGVQSLEGGDEAATKMLAEIEKFVEHVQDHRTELGMLGKTLHEEVELFTSTLGDVMPPAAVPAAEEDAAAPPAEEPAAG